MQPVWKDTFYTFTADTLSYYVTVNDETIYTGKAYRFPDAEEGKIQINRIAENYLDVELPRFSTISATTTYTHPEATGEFKLYNSSGDTLLGTYDFVWNYNYDGDTFSQNTGLSVPINSKFATNQFSLNTTYHTSNSGEVKTVIQRAVANACGEWALYYRNRKGGFDSFLIEGKVKKNDDYTTYDYETSIDNNYRDYDRETKRYKNLISSKYELNTGWLKDAEAEKLARHLLSSGYVVLHNLSTDQFIPVEITNTSAEYKTFNNERKMISYTINVEAANKEMVL